MSGELGSSLAFAGFASRNDSMDQFLLGWGADFASGFHAFGFAGAFGFTPKSHTSRLMD